MQVVQKMHGENQYPAELCKWGCNNAYVSCISIWMVDGGDCLKSQIFLSENRKSASGQGHGVFQSREDFSDSLGGVASWN